MYGGGSFLLKYEFCTIKYNIKLMKLESKLLDYNVNSKQFLIINFKEIKFN